MTGLDPGDFFRFVDLVGVFANAVLGGLIARRAGLDPIGFVTLAVLSGTGGGVLRDVMLQQGPPAALVDPWYMVIAGLGAFLSYVVAIEGRTWDKVWPWLDALALGCWSATGAQKTLLAGLGILAALVLGMVTAVGGGAVRDIVLRRVPAILGGNTLYATCALAASAVAVVGWRLGQPTLGMTFATITGAALVLLARRRQWILPSGDAWSRVKVRRPRQRKRGPRSSDS
ncbi:MAG: TRIC cation channel family protein [Micrococcales bacterium]|nr:TRIC cation channel family protein [Micrococcales bacterium]